MRQPALTETQQARICTLYATGAWSQTALARQYGVHQTTISTVLRTATKNLSASGRMPHTHYPLHIAFALFYAPQTALPTLDLEDIPADDCPS